MRGTYICPSQPIKAPQNLRHYVRQTPVYMFYIKCYDMTQTVILRLMQGGSLNEGIFVYDRWVDSRNPQLSDAVQ